MISLFDLDKIPIGSHSYNPFANVVLSERGNTSFSPFLTFPFRLKFTSESNFYLSLSLVSLKNK